MTKYSGVLEISNDSQKLINSGQARIEGANVVWNPGYGKSGVVEWGKFTVSPDNSQDLGNVGGEVYAIAAAFGVGIGIATLVNYHINLRQSKREKINNQLITCLSLYILEKNENKVKKSTELDLKLYIKEYIDNIKLFKNKVDIDLLNNISILLNTLEEDNSDIKNNIIQLDDYIKKNNKTVSFKVNSEESLSS